MHLQAFPSAEEIAAAVWRAAPPGTRVAEIADAVRDAIPPPVVIPPRTFRITRTGSLRLEVVDGVIKATWV